MKDPAQPLAEVFGYLITDHTEKADRYRSRRLCPFNNKVPNCTKDKAKDPLGVCSIYHEDQPVITCPIRFREDWIITDDAASFFFNEGTTWSSLTEVRLNDSNGKSAGNIDVVLVAYDADGTVYDFGALEIQAVYISGNVRDPFQHFMKDPKARASMDWSNQPNYPRPDYLSSSRKRLAPQLLFKGGILHGWRKKIAVALNKSFFDTLPKLSPVSKSKADIAWLIYDVMLPPTGAATALSYQTKLVRRDVVYSKWPDFLIPKSRITTQNAITFLRHLDVMLEKAVVAC
jgi:hypothetical protein